MNEYNTIRPNLILKEYGRNIQKLVEFIKTVEDREKRNWYAGTLIELMKQINPAIKETQETNQKLWDDLFIMANFDLDIDSPFPKPEPEMLKRKPDRLKYKASEIKYKHYGRNILLLVEKAKTITDPEEKESLIIHLGRLMKSFYITWNKETIDDESILENMRELSGHQLDYDINKIRENNLFDTLTKERRNKPSNNKSRRSNNQNNRRRRN